jgi:drug/metabolite transporter (DMT)-like permease
MSSPARPALPFAAFALCTLIWGSTFLFIRVGNDWFPPLWGVTIRLVLATVLLVPLAWAVRRPWPRGAELRAAVLFGVVDFGISLPFLYLGEKGVPSAIAAIVFATIPLMAMGLARLAGLERVRALKLAGALVGLAGVTLLVSSELRGHLPPLPLLCVFLGAASAAVAGVLLKRAPGHHPVATNAIAHAVGIPFCLAASFAAHESHALPHAWAAWVPIAYLVIVGSVVAFVVFTWLVQRWSIVRLSFISVITPVLATILGGLVRHERLGPATLVGALVVLAGLSLAIASDARAATRTRSSG